MTAFILRRIIATIPVLFFVGTGVFLILHITPGDPAYLLLGQSESPSTVARDIEDLRRHLGLDRPLWEQYFGFMWRSIKGDLGTSIFTGQPVSDMFKQRIEATLSLGLLAQIVALGFAIPLGVLAAWKMNTVVDRGVMLYVVLGFSVPQYWLAYNLIFLLAVRLGWLPAIGYSPISQGIGDWARHLVLPVVTVGLNSAALTTRITRSTMLEVLREDYIRTARAKGLSERTVLYRHALKNTAIPVITVVGLGLATIVGGIVIIEVVFAIPGMGRALVEAILKRDYPVIQGLILITAATFVVLNLVTDILYAYFDPRIRY